MLLPFPSTSPVRTFVIGTNSNRLLFVEGTSVVQVAIRAKLLNLRASVPRKHPTPGQVFGLREAILSGFNVRTTVNSMVSVFGGSPMRNQLSEHAYFLRVCLGFVALYRWASGARTGRARNGNFFRAFYRECIFFHRCGSCLIAGMRWWVQLGRSMSSILTSGGPFCTVGRLRDDT